MAPDPLFLHERGTATVEAVSIFTLKDSFSPLYFRQDFDMFFHLSLGSGAAVGRSFRPAAGTHQVYIACHPRTAYPGAYTYRLPLTPASVRGAKIIL